MIGIRFLYNRWYVCQRDLSLAAKNGESVDVFSHDCLNENHIVSGPFDTKEEASYDMIQNLEVYDEDRSTEPKCSRCGGSGSIDTYNGEVNCPKCNPSADSLRTEGR